MIAAETSALWGLGLLIAGPLMCLFCYHSWRNAKLIHGIMSKTPTSKIAKLDKGPAEVRGSIEPSKESLSSPWGRRRCVYYSFQVEEKRGDGESSSWYSYVNDVKSIPFSIKDDTGQVEIDSRNLKFELKKDHFSETGFLTGPSEYLKSLLEKRYRKKTKGSLTGVGEILFNKTLRFKEFSLELGEKVYVFGNAFPKEKPIQSNKENSKTNGESYVLRDGKMPLIITDKGCQAIESNFHRQIIWAITFSSLGAIAGIVGLLILIY